MKKPEFMGLLNDYMLEISDPKNKEEYDQYLEQLAKDGDLPKGMKLVRPVPGFCVKTKLISRKDKAQTQKLFINICSAGQIGKPYCQDAEGEGSTGKQWFLPYSAGKMRYDQDKQGHVCCTLDVAFHPWAMERRKQILGFEDFMISSALDAAKKQLGEREENVSKDHKVLKNTKCKGGMPALLTIRISSDDHDRTEMERRQGGEGKVPKMVRDIQQQKESSDNAKKQEIEAQQSKNDERVLQENEAEVEPIDEDQSEGIKVPKHRIIYSYPVEYETSIKPAKLDINDKNLIFDLENKFYLNLDLPYAVISELGKAIFDAKKHELQVRIPVDKSKHPKQDITLPVGSISTESEEDTEPENTDSTPNEMQPTSELKEDLEADTNKTEHDDSYGSEAYVTDLAKQAGHESFPITPSLDQLIPEYKTNGLAGEDTIHDVEPDPLPASNSDFEEKNVELVASESESKDMPQPQPEDHQLIDSEKPKIEELEEDDASKNNEMSPDHKDSMPSDQKAQQEMTENISAVDRKLSDESQIQLESGTRADWGLQFIDIPLTFAAALD